MKIVNDKGIAALKRWIEETSLKDGFGARCRTDSEALNVWAEEVEESMLAGNPPMVEMHRMNTRSGRPETFTLSPEMITDTEEDQ